MKYAKWDYQPFQSVSKNAKARTSEKSVCCCCRFLSWFDFVDKEKHKKLLQKCYSTWICAKTVRKPEFRLWKRSLFAIFTCKNLCKKLCRKKSSAWGFKEDCKKRTTASNAHGAQQHLIQWTAVATTAAAIEKTAGSELIFPVRIFCCYLVGEKKTIFNIFDCRVLMDFLLEN